MSENELNGAGARIAERAVGERSDLGAARASREGTAYVLNELADAALESPDER